MTEVFFRQLIFAVKEKEAVTGKKIRLIFSDMDGTLLDENGDLPRDFSLLIDALVAKDVFFVPASGRQHAALWRQLKEYEGIRAFISDNGTCLVLNGKELFLSCLETHDVFRILEVGKVFTDVVIALCTPHFAYVDKKWQMHVPIMQKFFTEFMLADDLESIFLRDDVKVLKVSFFDPLHMAKEKIYPVVAPHFPDLEVTLSGRSWVDISSLGVHKGTAARILRKHLHLKKEETASFGDYLNDVGLFEETFFSFAMQNAHEEVKKKASFVTLAHDEEGVTKTIFHLLQAGLLGR